MGTGVQVSVGQLTGGRESLGTSGGWFGCKIAQMNKTGAEVVIPRMVPHL